MDQSGNGQPQTRDRWSSGDNYEPFIGRWSRRVAPEFVDWLGVEPGASWVDVGCGTGALTAAILDRADPESVVGVEPSAGFAAYAAEHITDQRASFRSGDAEHLPLDDGSADVVVSGLIMNFLPDLAAGLGEMRRVLRSGGTLAGYVWDYAGEMQLLRVFWDTVAEHDPAASSLDEARRFAMCTPERLTDAYTAAGLNDVATTPIDVPTVFADFDDYWTPFLGGQGPASSYVVSLDEPSRDELREMLRARLPEEPDRSIALTARAWAVRGSQP